MLLYSCDTNKNSYGTDKNQFNTGGPCNYEDVRLKIKVLDLYTKSHAARLVLTPTQEKQINLFQYTYTSDTIVIYYYDKDSINMNWSPECFMEVMTSGTCNPYPNSIKLNADEYRWLVNPDSLNHTATDLKNELK